MTHHIFNSTAFIPEATTIISEHKTTPLFSLTLAQLEPCFKKWVYELLQAPEQEPEPKFLTRNEVCQVLHISKPTLQRYTQLKIIAGSKVGNRILYSTDAIKKAVQGIETAKYKRI